MTHEEKLEAMHRHMAALGVPAGTATPPAWRLLWRLGIEVPPPLFMPFGAAAVAMGGVFGLLWGVFVWLGFWARQGKPMLLLAWVSLCAGALFGVIMAGYFRHLARKHALPSWAGYAGRAARG